jgi:hypothetical protein
MYLPTFFIKLPYQPVEKRGKPLWDKPHHSASKGVKPMAFFETKIRHATLTFSPFSSESMMTIGQVVLDHIRERIQSVQDVTDSRAKPLKETYAEEKRKGRYVAMGGARKYTGLPYRDWTLRGRTLQSCKVKSASEDRVTIGPTLAETTMIILVRNRLDHMWGMSPSDYEALYAAVRQTLLRVKAVRLVKAA